MDPKPALPEQELDALMRAAKLWLEALRAGEQIARARFERAQPRPSTLPGLREVQQALAREHGFASWAALKDALDERALARQTRAEQTAAFLELACLSYERDSPWRRRRAAKILRLQPELVEGSIHAAVVAGDVQRVRGHLQREPAQAVSSGGPQRWEPLLFACFARLPGAPHTAVEIARLLLDAGADPNAHFLMGDGRYRFTALTGAIGHGEGGDENQPPHPEARALAELLLERGADPNDGQALYNTSLSGEDLEWLGLLLGHGLGAQAAVNWQHGQAPQGILDYLLGNAVTRNQLLRAQLLLDHGADANATHFYSRRPVYEVALLLGHLDLCALLRDAGATPVQLGGEDAFRAACMGGDASLARELAQQHPDYLQSFRALNDAARADRVEVVRLLLDLGMSPDLEDPHTGQRALHTCAAQGSLRVAELLIARRAVIDPIERTYQASPFSWAVHCGQQALSELLARHTRRVDELIAAGRSERLRELFEAEPALARPRPGWAPLCFLCADAPGDVAAAQATLELLLQHGADPHATNRDGKTAAELAEERGHDDIAELLWSARAGA